MLKKRSGGGENSSSRRLGIALMRMGSKGRCRDPSGHVEAGQSGWLA